MASASPLSPLPALAASPLSYSSFILLTGEDLWFQAIWAQSPRPSHSGCKPRLRSWLLLDDFLTSGRRAGTALRMVW